MSNITHKNSPYGLEKAVNIALILERQLCTDFSLYHALGPVEDTGTGCMIKDNHVS